MFHDLDTNTKDEVMKQRIRRGQKLWEELIIEQENSGLSAKRFCEVKSVGIASFYQWRRRLSGDGPRSMEKKRDVGFIDMGEMRGSRQALAPVQIGLELNLDLGGGVNLTLRRG